MTISPVRASRAVKSSNVAIGAASAFVALSALTSLVPERDQARVSASAMGPRSTWALRGTITPVEFGPRPTAQAKRIAGADAV